MNETGRDPTPRAMPDASAEVRVPADELADAEAVNAMVYRVNALAEGVRALADPDARDMPSPTEWDRTMRAIDGLARMIGEAAEDVMGPSGEILLASRIRAETTELPARSDGGGALGEAQNLACELLDATGNLRLLSHGDPWHADDVATMRDAIGGLATCMDRAARGILAALDRAQS